MGATVTIGDRVIKAIGWGPYYPPGISEAKIHLTIHDPVNVTATITLRGRDAEEAADQLRPLGLFEYT